MRSQPPYLRPAWQRPARRRRWCLIAGAVAPACAAGGIFVSTLPPGVPLVLARMLGILFAVLFAWLSWNAWTTVAGVPALLRPRRRAALGRDLDPGPSLIDPRLSAHAPNPPDAHSGPGADRRTAIVFPICDEDTARVFAGLEATYRSLRETGRLDGFDVFVLSDSRDLQTWMREETAWIALCRAVNGFGRIHYRRRTAPGGGKAENIADFCRRWGRLYRYMVVLDADSVMAGPAIAALVDMMDADPRVGIMQTVPVPVNRSSLFARIRQFASRLYGPLSTAGLAFWQQGDGVYWGHNAIIRVEPFMASCGLPRLPGTPPLGGPIMSHDVVEAAFMGRAGLTVWLVPDLEGSYEEIPPTLPDYLARDRRWCRGNLQHTRLLWQPGLSFGHRLHLLLGIGSYIAAPLWLLFLIAEMAVAAAAGPTHGIFGVTAGRFPSGWMVALLSATAALLLAPKALGLGLVLARSEEAQRFGGRLRCAVSAVLEMVFSALTAPIAMVSHAWFVFTILTGTRVKWTSPPRHDYALRWRDAMTHHTGATAAGTAWVAAAASIRRPEIVGWLTPILAGLLLSIPISVLSSSISLGTLARRWGLFLTPEEAAPPRVLRELDLALERGQAEDHAPAGPVAAFAQAVVDPIANAHHVWQATFRERDGAASATHLVEKAVRGGPSSLRADERAAILEDPESLAALHVAVWSAPTALTREWHLSG